MTEFDFDIQNIIKTIKEKNYTKIGLQFPEGLKRKAFFISREIEENTNVEIIISGNPCFGACDIDTFLAQKVDMLFHFGHAKLGNFENVTFIEARSNIDVIPAVKSALEFLKNNKIGLVTTVQHVHKLKEVEKFLKENGKEVIINKGDTRINYFGQVLGCNFTSAYIDCDEILYIGSGVFHPIGVAIATCKKVVVADPYLIIAHEISSEKFLKKRFGYISASIDAKVFGIIVSSKSGQNRNKLAYKIKELSKKHGKEAFVIMSDLVTPDQLLSFKVDAYVNTACPRIALDDAISYHAPILTPQEFEIVLGERKWDDYSMDEILDDEL